MSSFPCGHMRHYTIETTAKYTETKHTTIVSIYADTDGDIMTMVGNACIAISRATAAKILADNRRSGATVTRNPLQHGAYCACRFPALRNAHRRGTK